MADLTTTMLPATVDIAGLEARALEARREIVRAVSRARAGHLGGPRWKFSMGDLEERQRWDDYQAAFDEALSKTSTEQAPWYVIPANRN